LHTWSWVGCTLERALYWNVAETKGFGITLGGQNSKELWPGVRRERIVERMWGYEHSRTFFSLSLSLSLFLKSTGFCLNSFYFTYYKILCVCTMFRVAEKWRVIWTIFLNYGISWQKRNKCLAIIRIKGMDIAQLWYSGQT
jgi:hypothetical protein